MVFKWSVYTVIALYSEYFKRLNIKAGFKAKETLFEV